MQKILKITSSIACAVLLEVIFISADLKVDKHILHWTISHRLTFADFKGKSNLQNVELSVASSKNLTHKLGTISKNILVHFESRSGKIIFTIYAGMDTDSLWIRNPNDTTTLKHEQGHFDICEIYARILRKEIAKATSISEAKTLYDTTTSDEEEEQEKFDKENTYSLGGITPSWNAYTSSRLQELSAYDNPVLVLSIKN